MIIFFIIFPPHPCPCRLPTPSHFFLITLPHFAPHRLTLAHSPSLLPSPFHLLAFHGPSDPVPSQHVLPLSLILVQPPSQSPLILTPSYPVRPHSISFDPYDPSSFCPVPPHSSHLTLSHSHTHPSPSQPHPHPQLNLPKTTMCFLPSPSIDCCARSHFLSQYFSLLLLVPFSSRLFPSLLLATFFSPSPPSHLMPYPSQLPSPRSSLPPPITLPLHPSNSASPFAIPLNLISTTLLFMRSAAALHPLFPFAPFSFTL